MDPKTLKELVYDTVLDGGKMPHIIRDRHIRGYDERDLAGAEKLYEQQFNHLAPCIDIAMEIREQLAEKPMSLKQCLVDFRTQRELISHIIQMPDMTHWFLDAALDIRCKEDPNFLLDALKSASTETGVCDESMKEIVKIHAERDFIRRYLIDKMQSDR